MRTSYLLLSLLLPLNLLAQSLPEERIFIVSDKLDYMAGDSIRLEGRLMSNDSLALPYSRFVYVELFNEEDSVVERQKLVINEMGEFSTKMQVNPLLKQDIYYIRAFTKFMANFSERTFPIFPLRLGVKEQKDENLTQTLYANFFPEGGHLVHGHPQNMAVYLTDGNRTPVEAEYTLTDNEGNTLAKQKTTPSGWQIVSFNPQKGRAYHFHATHQGERFSFLLPEAYDSPIVQAINNRGRVIYRILQADQSSKEGKLYAYHKTSGLQILPVENETGIINLSGLEEGTVTLLLTNNQGRIISQTSTWYSPSEKGSMELGKEIYAPGENLAWEMPVQDSLTSVFVRILPETSLYVPHAEHSLAMEHDLQSSVPFLMHQTSNPKDLQAWLYSTWFKKFDVPRTVREGMNYRHKPEVNMQIQGQVKHARAPLSEGTLVAYNRKNGQTFDTTLDKKGRFILPVEDFQQGESFFVQAYSKHGKAEIYDYEMSNDTIPSVSNWNKVKDKRLVNETSNWNQTLFSFEGINELPEVIVKAKVVKEEKDPFTPDRFYGQHYLNSKALEEHNYQSFKDIVQYFHNYMELQLKPREPEDKKSSLNMRNINTAEIDEWVLWPKRVSTVDGYVEIKILIDGIPFTTTEAMNMLEVSQVKSVEYLNPGLALAVTHGAINGALVIKTKGYEKKKVESKGIQYLPPMGLSNMDMKRQTDQWKVPTESGKYQVLIDVLSPTKGNHSYVFPIEVK